MRLTVYCLLLKDIELLCGCLGSFVGLRSLKIKKVGEIQADVDERLGALPFASWSLEVFVTWAFASYGSFRS